MTKKRLLAYFRELARIERYPSLARFHGRSRASVLWTFSRDSVARGVAVGFFFGILTPVAQIIFAIVAAIIRRGNLMVAAGSTLITNPLILPVVYYHAYRVGSFLVGNGQAQAAELTASEEAAQHALDVPGWIPTLVDWGSTIGLPLVIGVVSLAVGMALAGYVLVHLVWGFVSLVRR
jgi:uncharacterized protein (DUF2062 family)